MKRYPATYLHASADEYTCSQFASPQKKRSQIEFLKSSAPLGGNVVVCSYVCSLAGAVAVAAAKTDVGSGNPHKSPSRRN